MIAVSSNWKDLQRCYELSYIKIKGFGDKLFLVTRVNKDLMSGNDNEDTAFELWLSDDAPFDIDYLLPHHAVFQYGNEAVQLRRIPSRQYRRGLHSDNTIIRSIVTGNKFSLGFPILEAYVGKQQYPTLEEAISLPNISTALSSRMSYVRESGSIYIDTTPIAIVKDREIKVTRSIFYKEIFHYINQTNQLFKVRV